MLTTGTGCIFGFLVARQAYDAAVMAPLFVAMSLSLGLAVFVLALTGCRIGDRPVPSTTACSGRLARLQALFVSVVLYFVIARHLANLYVAEHAEVERFLLVDGGAVPGGVLDRADPVAGTLVLPLAILWGRRPHLAVDGSRPRRRSWWGGGLSQLYGIIIGGQAAPLDIFPGKEVIEGALVAGEPANYVASLPELLLGLGGVAVAGLILVIAVRVLRILPGRFGEAGAEATRAESGSRQGAA